jgi:hypothetical protein
VGKMRCTCGNVMSNSGSPNDVEHYLISSRLVEHVDNGLVPAPSDPDDLPASPEEAASLDYQLHIHADDVWKCGQCGRLHVFGDKRSNRVTAVYAPENR